MEEARASGEWFGWPRRRDEALFSMGIKINASSSDAYAYERAAVAFQRFRICTARPTRALPFISCRFRVGPNPLPGSEGASEKTRRDKKRACTVYWRHGPRFAAPASAFIEHCACNSTGAPTVALPMAFSPRLPFLRYLAFHIAEISRILLFFSLSFFFFFKENVPQRNDLMLREKVEIYCNLLYVTLVVSRSRDLLLFFNCWLLQFWHYLLSIVAIHSLKTWMSKIGHVQYF